MLVTGQLVVPDEVVRGILRTRDIWSRCRAAAWVVPQGAGTPHHPAHRCTVGGVSGGHRLPQASVGRCRPLTYERDDYAYADGEGCGFDNEYGQKLPRRDGY